MTGAHNTYTSKKKKKKERKKHVQAGYKLTLTPLRDVILYFFIISQFVFFIWAEYNELCFCIIVKQYWNKLI